MRRHLPLLEPRLHGLRQLTPRRVAEALQVGAYQLLPLMVLQQRTELGAEAAPARLDSKLDGVLRRTRKQRSNRVAKGAWRGGPACGRIAAGHAPLVQLFRLPLDSTHTAGAAHLDCHARDHDRDRAIALRSRSGSAEELDAGAWVSPHARGGIDQGHVVVAQVVVYHRVHRTLHLAQLRHRRLAHRPTPVCDDQPCARPHLGSGVQSVCRDAKASVHGVCACDEFGCGRTPLGTLVATPRGAPPIPGPTTRCKRPGTGPSAPPPASRHSRGRRP